LWLHHLLFYPDLFPFCFYYRVINLQKGKQIEISIVNQLVDFLRLPRPYFASLKLRESEEGSEENQFTPREGILEIRIKILLNQNADL
jgi:hypothetical protein